MRVGWHSLGTGLIVPTACHAPIPFPGQMVGTMKLCPPYTQAETITAKMQKEVGR